MQERHDNDEIEPHNHKYPLLYKEAETSMSGLGVPEVLHITCNMCTHDLPNMYSGKFPRAYVTTICKYRCLRI